MNHLAGQHIIDALRAAGYEAQAAKFEICKEVRVMCMHVHKHVYVHARARGV